MITEEKETKTPKQLQDEKYRFRQIIKNTKKPVSKRNDNYKWNELPACESYCVDCGHGNLFVIDFDSKDIQDKHLKDFPKTFSVKSGGKKLLHLYLKDKKVSRGFRVKDNEGKTIVDVQGAGTYVLGPNSVHDITKDKYEVENDIEIAEFSMTETSKIFKNYKTEYKNKEKSEDNSYVIKTIKCPFHDDKTPSLAIYSTETYYCFGCGKSGEVSELEKEEKTLSEEEQKTAIEILKDSNLFNNITETEFDKTIIGEKKTKKAIFLSRCAIWIDDERMNTVVGGASSVGKDYVLKWVMKIFPENTYIYRTRISPKVFTYWHKGEKNWTWNNKNLCLTDIDDAVLNDPVFKVMLSEGARTTIIIRQKAVDIQIPGIPNIIITTAEANPSNQILTRVNLISLDESNSQTEKIMEYESEKAETGEVSVYDKNITNALSLLNPVKVIVPYAKKLNKYFPHIVKMRRVFDNFIGFIRASAALHQYQREKDEKGRVISNEQDYEIAREIIETIRHETITGLTASEKKYLEKFTKLVENDPEEKWFSYQEIANKTGYVSPKSWWTAMTALKEKNLVLSKQDQELYHSVTRYSIKPKQKEQFGTMLPNFEILMKK